MTDLVVQGERLELVAASLAHLEAELDHPQRLAGLLGARLPADWPPGDYDRPALAYFHERLAADGAQSTGWYLWYARTRGGAGRRGDLVGGAGFFGPPVERRVEIGYSLVAEARGLGYAVEMVNALSDWAYSGGRVDRIVAHAAETNAASARVLRRCGFAPVGAGGEAGTLRYCRNIGA